jgi:hypothetical protein
MVTNKLYFVVFLLLLFACNKGSNMDCENPDYSSCNTTEPVDGYFRVIVTKQEKNSKVPLILYQGKFGSPERKVFDSVVSIVDTTFILPLNHDYYAIATYIVNGKTINAVDGAYFEKFSKTECDSVCWSIKGDEIDVRLKY